MLFQEVSAGFLSDSACCVNPEAADGPYGSVQTGWRSLFWS